MPRRAFCLKAASCELRQETEFLQPPDRSDWCGPYEHPQNAPLRTSPSAATTRRSATRASVEQRLRNLIGDDALQLRARRQIGYIAVIAR